MQGYEPFGSLLPGRNYSSDSYRFGFNGQEKDDEVFGATGTSYTAEFWQYDPRTGRRWNMDPVDKPWMSPYHAFSNKPIWNIDPNGANDDHYVDSETGEYLGEDGAATEEVRVIDRSEWDKVKDPKSAQGTQELQGATADSKLGQYHHSINVPQTTWDKVVKNGGAQMAPYVDNQGTHPAYFKPGSDTPDQQIHDAGAYVVNPGEQIYAPVDGVATYRLSSAARGIGNEQVLQVHGSARVRITNAGEVPTGGLGTTLRDRNWLNGEMNPPSFLGFGPDPDFGFKLLFDRATFYQP